MQQILIDLKKLGFCEWINISEEEEEMEMEDYDTWHKFATNGSRAQTLLLSLIFRFFREEYDMYGCVRKDCTGDFISCVNGGGIVFEVKQHTDYTLAEFETIDRMIRLSDSRRSTPQDMHMLNTKSKATSQPKI